MPIGNMLRFVVFGVLAACAAAATTQVEQCTQNAGELPINTYIAGCASTPCGLPQLEDAIINLTFKAPRNINSMTTLATAYLVLMGIQIPVPYDLAENSVTCNSLVNASCPVAEDEVLEYALRLYIEPVFPVGVSTAVEFRIVDDANNSIVCVRVPITILPPGSTRVNFVDSN